VDPHIVMAPLGDNPPKAELYYGRSALASLRALPSDSVSMACTSPPYWGLRNYGSPPEVWGGNENCEHKWDDEMLLTNPGRRDPEHRGRHRIEGDTKTDGEGKEGVYPKSVEAFCQKCGAWRGNLGLEPTPDLFIEHLVLIFRELRRVLHPTGTLWVNLGDSYMSHVAKDYANLGGREGERSRTEGGYNGSIVIGKPSVEGLKDKDLVGIPWRAALALQADGWWLRNNIIWKKSNAMPSSVQDRFSCKYEYVFLFAKQARYFFDLHAVKVPHTSGTYDANGAFTPCQNWNETEGVERKMDQTDGQLGSMAGSPRRSGRNEYSPAGKNPGDIWEIATASYKGAHFACWPPRLVERMILAGTSSEGRCPTCKTPWKRVTEILGDVPQTHRRKHLAKSQSGEHTPQTGGTKKSTLDSGIGGDVPSRQRLTTGWVPACDCPAHKPEPCTVLDPFSGSATTGMVAMKHGRNYTGLDLNADYLGLAEARLLGNKPPSRQKGEEPDLIGGLFG